MGVDMRYGTPVNSMKEAARLGGFDAVFVGSGAPKGKELEIPGPRTTRDQILIGIDWLDSVAFRAHLRRSAIGF